MKRLLFFTLFIVALVGCATPPKTDQAAVREQIYLRYFAETHASARFVYFVSESETFITALKSASGLAYVENSSAARYDQTRDETVHVSTGKAGIKMKISDIVVDGDEASAKFIFEATSVCAGGYHVRLMKKDGRWVITDWKQEWIS